MRRALLAAGVVFWIGCGGAEKSDVPDPNQNSKEVVNNANNVNNVNHTNNEAEPLPDRCQAGTSFLNGVSVFKDRSVAAGLREINAEGVRISAADVDGDGFLDLYARRTGQVGDDFSAEGRRTSWLLRNRGDGTFEDVTQSSGIVSSRFDATASRPADVTVWGDVDNDGDLDAFSGFTNDGSVFDAPTILLNNGDGTFSPYRQTLGFQVRAAKTSIGGASFVDANRDGRLDLWIGRGTIDGVPQADQLFIQEADGSFVDQSAELGIVSSPWSGSDVINRADAHTNSWGTTACDLDSDGYPELMSASYGRAPNHLWASKDGKWSNESIASGYAFDDNADWSDNHSARCFCQASRMSAGCLEVPEPLFACGQSRAWVHERDTQAFRLGGNSGTTVCSDLNNDGHLDLLTTEIVHFDVGTNSDASEVLYNDGSGRFVRPGNAATGLEKTHTIANWNDGDITAATLDFDNDGRNDVLMGSTDYAGTRAWLYWQNEDGDFRPLTTSEGMNHNSAHGVVVGDFDNDGDQDVVMGHSANRCSTGDHCYPAGERHVRYFENTLGQDGNWVQLVLEGAEGSNRSAIGAQVRVTRGDQVQVQEIGGGHGHYGLQSDRVLHFGMGAACGATVTIRWPDSAGTQQTFELQTGYRYALKQGDAPRALNL